MYDKYVGKIADQLWHSCTVTFFHFHLFFAQCKWYRGKTEIKKSETYEIEQEGLTHRLIIHSATLSDTGKYKCTFDDQSTFCNLTIRGALYPPEMLSLFWRVHDVLLTVLLITFIRLYQFWVQLSIKGATGELLIDILIRIVLHIIFIT